MAIEFRRGGRKVSSGDFFKRMMDDALDEVMNSYAEEVHGKAASVVDPETGNTHRSSCDALGNRAGPSSLAGRLLSRERWNKDWDSTGEKSTA